MVVGARHCLARCLSGLGIRCVGRGRGCDRGQSCHWHYELAERVTEGDHPFCHSERTEHREESKVLTISSVCLCWRGGLPFLHNHWFCWVNARKGQIAKGYLLGFTRNSAWCALRLRPRWSVATQSRSSANLFARTAAEIPR